MQRTDPATGFCLTTKRPRAGCARTRYPIDSGTKVALGVQRIFNPRKAQEEAAKRKAAAEAAAAAAKANKKKGSWGGLP